MLSNKISDLADLAGQGTAEDRQALKAKTVAAQSERATAQLELTRLRQARDRQRALITPQRVREILSDFTTLLEDGAAGKLGGDVIYRAAEVFRQLTCGRIDVQIESRPGRKRPNCAERSCHTCCVPYEQKRRLPARQLTCRLRSPSGYANHRDWIYWPSAYTS